MHTSFCDPKSGKALYYLGCPAWSVPEWRGTFLSAGIRTSELLGEYSRIFNTVEGNSFFYALPRLDVIRRWAMQAAQGFEFCFKVPRMISHTKPLSCTGTVHDHLLKCLDCVAQQKKLGPTFLQLHTSFSPERLPELENFCKHWPTHFPLAVEVRHLNFFVGGPAKNALHQLLKAHQTDRVIFDSRALFDTPPEDSAEKQAQGRKPRLPVCWEVTGQRPMIRFVGRNTIQSVNRWQDEVADKVAAWIEAHRRPYVFMHTPDDTRAPQLCLQFHRKLQARIPGLPELKFPTIQQQTELF